MTRLYVVDDDRGFLDLVDEVATPMGFETVAAAEAKAFKSLYQREPNAVVMIDMIMPDTDGIELLTWLGEHGAPGAIILVTGFAGHYTQMARVLATAKGLLVTDSLSKPVKLAELRDALLTAKDAAANDG